jgi:hypothetical protein
MPWLVSSWLTAKGRVSPVAASSAPTPVAFTPLSESNRPAATTCEPPPVTTRARTALLVAKLPLRLPLVSPTPGWGAHGSSVPSAALTAASRVRLTPPTAVMLPPR